MTISASVGMAISASGGGVTISASGGGGDN